MRIVVIMVATVMLWASARDVRAQACGAELAERRVALEAACPCASLKAKKYKKCVKTAAKALPGITAACASELTKLKTICGLPNGVVCCNSKKGNTISKKSTACLGKKLQGTACGPVANPPFSRFPMAGIDCVDNACPVVTTTTTIATTSTTGPPESTTTTTSTTSTTTTTIPTLCVGGAPNGTLEAGEECDTGNTTPGDGDGCSRYCNCCGSALTKLEGYCLAPTHPTLSSPQEECEDGNNESGDGCDADCTVSRCGNGVTAGAETCDDANTREDDSCPNDCIVDACTPTMTAFAVTVSYTGNADVGGITVLLDYPEGKVDIFGSGGPLPMGVITDLPTFTSPAENDFDHTLKLAVISTFPPISTTTPAALFTVHFRTCEGASLPTSGDFTCTVVDSSNSAGAPIPSGVTCSVAIP